MSAVRARLSLDAVVVAVLGCNRVQRGVLAACRRFRASVVARDPSAIVVQLLGSRGAVDEFIAHLPPNSTTLVCRGIPRQDRS